MTNAGKGCLGTYRRAPNPAQGHWRRCREVAVTELSIEGQEKADRKKKRDVSDKGNIMCKVIKEKGYGTSGKWPTVSQE